MLRGTTPTADHSPILAAALLACLAVLGGIVPGVPAPASVPPVEMTSLARPGSTLQSLLDIVEEGFPRCELVRTQLIGNGGAELNALRSAYPKSEIVISAERDALRNRAADILVCPR